MTNPYEARTAGVAGNELTAEQAAFLREQQARQAAAESSDIAASQASTQSQMTERGPLLPAETKIDELMAALRAQSEQIAALQAQVGTVQTQMEEAQAATGGPPVLARATAVSDKLDAMQVQYPNNPLGLHHFDAPREAAGHAVEAARALTKNGKSGADKDISAAAAIIEKFAARTHRKLGGMHVDWSALLDDLELMLEEAAKLVAA